MALPALKCPYLAQMTLKQVRASAPVILNNGIESCPIFGQFIRQQSTTTTGLSYQHIKAVHENLRGQTKVRLPTNIKQRTNPYGEGMLFNIIKIKKINLKI